jgi:anti-sigma-K factor RskA
MPRNRFVVPAVTTITLSDGDWIQVKNQLTVGEERAAFQQIIGEINQTTGWRKPNIALQGIAEIAAYLVAWSFRDPEGQPIPPDVATIQLLDVDSYRELEAAVETHIKTMEAQRAAAKNGKAKSIESGTTSPSAEPVSGLTAI